MHKKFEINRTKIKGGCQSGSKVVTQNCKSDLPLEYNSLFLISLKLHNLCCLYWTAAFLQSGRILKIANIAVSFKCNGLRGRHQQSTTSCSYLFCTVILANIHYNGCLVTWHDFYQLIKRPLAATCTKANIILDSGHHLSPLMTFLTYHHRLESHLIFWQLF